FRWLLKEEPSVRSQEVDVVDIHDTLLSHDYNVADNKDTFLKTKLTVSDTVVRKIAELTVGQSLSPLWFIARRNRITASICGRILGCIKRNRFPPSIFKAIYGMDA